MGTAIRMVAKVNERFSNLVSKKVNEPLVLTLMNLSRIVFPGHYEWVESQSSGECDFVDIDTGCKYDAKLPLTKKQGALIGSRNHDYADWMKTMIELESEFADCICSSDGVKNVEKLELYCILQDCLNKLQEDENGIFFFPYPIVMDAEDLCTCFCMDLLDHIYDTLRKNGHVGERDIYVIDPSMDAKIVLRNMKTDAREYLLFPELDKYIIYQHYPDLQSE